MNDVFEATFVYSRQSAPAGQAPFCRYGDDIVVVWDAEDPTTDVYLKCAYSVARALVVKLRYEAESNGDVVLGAPNEAALHHFVGAGLMYLAVRADEIAQGHERNASVRPA